MTYQHIPQAGTSPQGHGPSIYTGDPTFDQEANRKAERLRRRKIAAQQSAGNASGVVGAPQATGPGNAEPSLALLSPSSARVPSSDGHHSIERDVSVNPESHPADTPAASPTSPTPFKTAQVHPARPVVGKVIDEGHANFVLMYNMLTGIRIGVSRSEAKERRKLAHTDYVARHKFTFDIVGNELAPSGKGQANYDFKFKDYAPLVFRDLRELFHLDAADYLLSLTSQYILSELGSPGKSGSFFYFSRDYRFIIKTISHGEHRFLLRILPEYHEHVRKNPHTLLSRFYGLHRVKLPHGRKVHFVVMQNLFPPHRDIHETYDLKGSLVGREYSEAKASSKKGATMKDINWLRRARHIELGSDKHRLLHAQLQSDIGLLKRLDIMDYSLLIGLHDMRKGNSENLRQENLTVFQPSETGTRPQPLKRDEAWAVRQAVQRSDPRSLDHVDAQLPAKDGRERLYCVFYQDEGGFRSTHLDTDEPGDWIYYLGVIDITTLYTPFKRAEHLLKSVYLRDRTKLSPVRPKLYGQRFLQFMQTISQPPPASWPGWKPEAEAGAHSQEDSEAIALVEQQVQLEGRVTYGDGDHKHWWNF